MDGFVLYRADTGTFVLVHEASGTTVVGEDPAALYDELSDKVPTDARAVAGREAATPKWARYGIVAGLLMVAVLPFLWLSALDYTLGRMLDDRRLAAPDASVVGSEIEEATVDELRALRHRVDELEAKEVARPVPQGRGRRPARPPAHDPADLPPSKRPAPEAEAEAGGQEGP